MVAKRCGIGVKRRSTALAAWKLKMSSAGRRWSARSQATSGVSLDDEMVNMLQQQQAFQASSRVGRDVKKPGLVVTNYNPFKPRDRSHFETFRPYHEATYRYVEPTSVTPFSLPVVERAIHALAVALIRFFEPSLRDGPGSGPSGGLQNQIREIVCRRIERVAPEEATRTRAVLDRFFEDWLRMQPGRYGDFAPHPPDIRPLMIPAGRMWRERDDAIPRSTPSSMRNVDAESDARVIQSFSSEGT